MINEIEIALGAVQASIYVVDAALSREGAKAQSSVFGSRQATFSGLNLREISEAQFLVSKAAQLLCKAAERQQRLEAITDGAQ